MSEPDEHLWMEEELFYRHIKRRREEHRHTRLSWPPVKQSFYSPNKNNLPMKPCVIIITTFPDSK